MRTAQFAWSGSSHAEPRENIALFVQNRDVWVVWEHGVLGDDGGLFVRKEGDSIGDPRCGEVPHPEERTGLIENLDAGIGAIAHVHVVMRTGGEGVREPELAFASAGAAPFVEETSACIEVRDPRVFVSVGNQDGTVGQVGDVGWHVEVGWTGAGTAGFTEHQERFTLWTELDHLM